MSNTEIRSALVVFASAVRSGAEADIATAIDAVVSAIGAITPKQDTRNSYTLKDEDSERIVGLIKLTNEHRVLKKLNVGRATLARAVAGLSIRRGSLLALEDGLRNTDSDWAAREMER